MTANSATPEDTVRRWVAALRTDPAAAWQAMAIEARAQVASTVVAAAMEAAALDASTVEGCEALLEVVPLVDGGAAHPRWPALAVYLGELGLMLPTLVHVSVLDAGDGPVAGSRRVVLRREGREAIVVVVLRGGRWWVAGLGDGPLFDAARQRRQWAALRSELAAN